MEGSSSEEEEVPERTATFYLYHPCYFLKEALIKGLLKCLGFEIGTNRDSNRKEHKSSDSEDQNPSITENTASNDQQCSKEALTTAEEDQDQKQNSNTQGFELMASITMARRGPRRSELSRGPPPQNN